MNDVSIFRSFTNGPGVLYETPGAGGGGGAAPAGAATPAPDHTGAAEPPSAPADGAAAAAPASDDDGDELDVLLDDEADGDPAGPVDPQRLLRLRTAHNRIKRRFAKAAPTLRALRQAGVTDVSSVLSKAQQFDELTTAFQRNPKVLQALFAEPDPAAKPDEPAAPAAFDPKALPFEVSDADPLTGFLATLAREVHDLKAENALLKSSVTQDQTSRRQAAETRERATWSTALEQAKKELPAHLHAMFNDVMVTAFQNRHRHRQPVQKIVDHYLSELRKANQISSTQQRVASAAAKQQAADANGKTWPRHMGGGSGVPAPASRATQSLKDLNRRIRTGTVLGG